MQDGDACLYLDFRADRAIEMAMAFTYHDFPYFDRGQRPDVYFAGMTEYNEDLHVPEHTLVAPPRFQHNLAQFLSDRGVSQFAISETVKFGHITYYFKGNSHVALPGEETAEIPSYTEAFNTRPWMKTAEITDRLLAALESEKYQFLRVNYPGGDMVGHFGEMQPTVVALEAIDLALAQIITKVNQLGGITLITADHGNAILPQTGYRTLGFGALGGEGRMACFRPDALWIVSGRKRRRGPDIWVAVSPTPLPGLCQALAPPEFASYY